jgi:hypothetical protein
VLEEEEEEEEEVEEDEEVEEINSMLRIEAACGVQSGVD